MTQTSVALKQYLSKIGLEGDVDFLRESIQLMTQMLIELEAEEQIGAEKHECTPERNNHRNGYRQRQWEVRVGEIDVRIPKLRKGSYHPSLLQSRRRTEKALLAVVQQAYI
jgi:transposase-like protein